MTIEQLFDHYKDIAIPHDPDPEYATEKWWEAFRDRIRKWLVQWHAPRELFDFLGREYITGLGPVFPAGSPEAFRLRVDEQVDALLAANNYKYKHLYDLYIAEYNPLWNVDGTEKLTIVESGEEKGTDTRTTTGTDKTQQSGTDTLQKGGTDTIQDQTTTYDSDTDRDTERNLTTYGATETRTPNLTETRTPNLTETRTPNLNHKIERTEVKERGGNIGTTMTQQLEEAEYAWVHRLNLIRMIVNDIAAAISYPY